MAGIDLRKACLDCLSQLTSEAVKDALVYLDAGAGEAFHFMGGLAALLPFGPRAVCSLENASPLDTAVQLNMSMNEPFQKVLVITTYLLSDAHRYILRCLRAHSSVKVCTVLTSISEEAHSAHPDTPLGPDAFHDYKRLLLEDFQVLVQKTKSDHAAETKLESESDNLTRTFKGFEGHGQAMELNLPEQVDHAKVADGEFRVETEGAMEDHSVHLIVEVKHFPMIICPLMSRAFVFPSRGMLAGAPLSHKADKALGIGLPRIDAGAVTDDDDSLPIGGTLVAHFLHHLAVQLSLKFDVFTLGPLSHDVGKLLTELSGIADVSGRSKRPAGLLLIDRTLDLITPCCHGDSLMDRFFASFPRRNNENNLQKLVTNADAVRRRPLDIRVSDGTWCMQDVSTPGLPSKELCVLMSNLENEGGLQSITQTGKRRDDTADCKPLNGMVPMLCTMGGSLFDSVKSHESGHIDLLFEKRVKESLLMIKKWLQEALRQEKMNPHGRSRLSAISVQEIHSLSKQLSQNLASAVRHADLIQISKAVELALGSVFGPKWEALSSAEKILSLSVGDSSQSVAFQIRDLVHQSIHTEDSRSLPLVQAQEHSLLSLRDALTLAIVGYGLAGDSFGSSPFSWEEERELKQAVIDAILQGYEPNVGFLGGLEDSLAVHRQVKESGAINASDFHQPGVAAENSEQDVEVNFGEGWEAWEDEDVVDTSESKAGGGGYGEMQLQLEVRDRVEEVFKRLHRVSEARRFLKVKDKSLLLDDNDGFGSSLYTQRSLLYRVLSLIFARADVPGMEHHSSAVGRFFKTGLGRFGLGQTKPKLSDSKVILVFVIGGINGVEVCEVKEAQAAYKVADGIDVLLGGTTFLAPDDIFDLLIGSSTCL